MDPWLINWSDAEGRTLLHLTVGKENVVLLRYLVTLAEIDINAQDHIKRTPLHLAAVLGNCYSIAYICCFEINTLP